jgi:hypothetical protein
VPSPRSAEGRTVWTYLARYRGRIGLGVAMLLATNLLYLGIPIYQGAAVDALDHGDPGGDVPRYAIFLIGFAVATAMSRNVSRPRARRSSTRRAPPSTICARTCSAGCCGSIRRSTGPTRPAT